MVENTGEIAAHLTTGATVVYFIEWLKKQPWATAVTKDSNAVNRIISFGGAVVAVMGISFSYDPMIGGSITLPPLAIMLGGAWEVVKQYMLQQVLFDTAVRDKTKTVVVTQSADVPWQKIAASIVDELNHAQKVTSVDVKP